MGGAIPPLAQYSLMAWCSVKERTTLPLPFVYSMQRTLKDRKNNVPQQCILLSLDTIESQASYLVVPGSFLDPKTGCLN
jgi:hypothetical protein